MDRPEYFLLLTNVSNPMRSIFRILSFSIIAVLILSSVSCAKEDETCTVIVKVVGASGTPANGAKVTLTSLQGLGESKELADYLPAEKLTDYTGSAEFTFKYPAILDIEVTHVSSAQISSDLIKLEVGKTVNKTITLQ